MNFREKTIAERQELYRRKEILEEELKQLLSECRKKREEIEDIAKKPTTVILFRHHFHFENQLTFRELKKRGIILSAPQTISEISKASYDRIKELGGIDGRFTVD